MTKISPEELEQFLIDFVCHNRSHTDNLRVKSNVLYLGFLRLYFTKIWTKSLGWLCFIAVKPKFWVTEILFKNLDIRPKYIHVPNMSVRRCSTLYRWQTTDIIPTTTYFYFKYFGIKYFWENSISILLSITTYTLRSKQLCLCDEIFSNNNLLKCQYNRICYRKV